MYNKYNSKYYYGKYDICMSHTRTHAHLHTYTHTKAVPIHMYRCIYICIYTYIHNNIYILYIIYARVMPEKSLSTPS